MGWVPLQGVHAIERVRVTATFREPLPERQSDLIAEDLETRRAVCGFQPATKHQNQPHAGLQIHIGSGSPSANDRPRWEFRRPGPVENQAIEIATLSANGFFLETAEYDRWAGFLDRVLGFFGSAFSRAAGVVGIASFNLEYFDRFVFEGEVTEASPVSLLDGIQGLLPQDALSGSEPWHLHRGWIERSGDSRLLVNKNFDVQDGSNPAGQAVRSIQIYTKTEQLFAQPLYDVPEPQQFLNLLHKRNKELFVSSLQPSVSNIFDGESKAHV